uniref:Secreted protein n=1 Tax=Bactrocera latifrons TaxID=174628 RepID=A0A0K8U7M8_BACLA
MLMMMTTMTMTMTTTTTATMVLVLVLLTTTTTTTRNGTAATNRRCQRNQHEQAQNTWTQQQQTLQALKKHEVNNVEDLVQRYNGHCESYFLRAALGDQL